jgi:cytochrome b subunit of formate dehydrogenase
MKTGRMLTNRITATGPLILLLLLIIGAAQPGWAQKEVTSEIYRYRDREMSARHYETYEYKPRTHMPFIKGQIPRRELIEIAPTAERIRHRKYLADAHLGLKFYERRTCVDCHPQQARSMHMVRLKLTCRHCHGPEPIAGIAHYYSSMNPRRRYAFVCSKCHKGSNFSYSTFKVHEPNPAAKTTLNTFPALSIVFWGMIGIAVGTFAVFLPHTFLWGLREMLALRGKKGAKKRKRIRRFTPAQRIFHFLLLLCFLNQAASGLARMYIETDWGRFLASFFGGYQGSFIVHKWAGIFMLVLFAAHLIYLLVKIEWRRFPKSIYGSDSMLPRLEDIGQALQHVRWMLGSSKAPQFDRWGYWEKFDYWAVFWGMIVLGVTGLILFDSVFSSYYIPGWSINIALWIHRIEAILAMAHVFIIHFFIGHLRRHSFPMDLAMFEGSVDLESTRHEKPAWIGRVEKAGQLESVLVAESGPARRFFFYLFGYAALAFGIFLLLGGLINSLSITW